jgi:DNA-binding NtrC family response regulator
MLRTIGDAGDLVSTLHIPRVHRRCKSPVLIVGGTSEERQAVAFAFHRMMRAGRGLFVSLDARFCERALRRSLSARLCVGCVARPDLLRASRGGLLFVDWITAISLETQRLLLAFIHSLGREPDPPSRPWAGRLAVGSEDDPAIAVENGSMLRSLHDALDMIRVPLGDRSH